MRYIRGTAIDLEKRSNVHTLQKRRLKNTLNALNALNAEEKCQDPKAIPRRAGRFLDQCAKRRILQGSK